MVGLDSGIWSGRDVSRGKEFWIVKRHPANPIKPSVSGGPTPPVSDVEMSKFSTTIRRTVVVKLDLAPDEGGGASVWLHPLGVGLVDVNRPPDCILPCLDLTGMNTIRIIGTAFLEVGPLRMGPTAAHVDTLARKTEVFQFDAGDEFSGDPGCVYRPEHRARLDGTLGMDARQPKYRRLHFK